MYTLDSLWDKCARYFRYCPPTLLSTKQIIFDDKKVGEILCTSLFL